MRLAALLATALLILGGCADGTRTEPGATVQQVRVFADESLREAFDQIGTLFEQQHPQSEVLLSYGAGIDLARRIAGGESAEVLVTDDPSAMATVGAAERAETLAGGRLSVAALAPAGEPFVTFVKEGAAQRVLTDTGILRP
ncbi:substrate-binding domain-containing protein [Actinoplanes sp. NPDC024001]|uniref:molybdate ABC transporter substrate-binding protein n=1 Tax=Actinoplanes sp. NPDC024001 TaxID=3154598 RepID=UPI0033E19D47